MRKSSSNTQESIYIYGHPGSDVAIFVVNLFIFTYAIQSLYYGWNETCEFPLRAWLIAQTVCIFLLQLGTPLLLTINNAVLAPVICSTLFVFQWVMLFLGYQNVFAPSNCISSSPMLFGACYSVLIVYTLSVPLQTIHYLKFYKQMFANTNK